MLTSSLTLYVQCLQVTSSTRPVAHVHPRTPEAAMRFVVRTQCTRVLFRARRRSASSWRGFSGGRSLRWRAIEAHVMAPYFHLYFLYDYILIICIGWYIIIIQ